MLDPSLLVLRLAKIRWMLRRPRFWALLRIGVGPSLEHEEMLTGHRFETVVDVGANRGQFTLWAQETLGAGSVVCVEPSKSALPLLRQVAALARCEVRIIEAAFSAQSGVADLFVAEDDDASSLLEPRPGSGPRVNHRQEVLVGRGDDLLAGHLLGSPILIKIDVQGAEADVLEGMPRTLAAADAVLVEVSFEQLYEGQAKAPDVVRRLLDAGFKFRAAARVPGGRSAWKLEQADLFFERPKAP